MKRGILVLLSLSVLVAVAYFTASKWAIRHETIAFHDPDRGNRLVAVNVAVSGHAGMFLLFRPPYGCSAFWRRAVMFASQHPVTDTLSVTPKVGLPRAGSRS